MMVLVTGGSGSGKSAFAEDQVLSFGPAKRIYIATMHPWDEESKKRVQRHRQMRAGKGFETVECYTGLKKADIPSDSVVLLECMSNLMANEMFEQDGAGKDAVQEIMEGIHLLRRKARHLVVVTNEIFSDGTIYEGEMADYLQYLGEVNQKMAQEADMAVEVVYGIPVYIKGAPDKRQGKEMGGEML